MPVYVIPGNHDAREPMRAAFADRAYFPASGFLQYTVEDLPVRLIALDTLVEGKGHGALCDERLAWLEARLGEKRPSRRCCSCIIRRSIAASTPSTMRACSEGDERLAELVRQHSNVERAMCGHVHRPIQVRWAGTMASIAPSTAHQATLDLHDSAPLTHDDGAAGDRAAPVAAGTPAWSRT